MSSGRSRCTTALRKNSTVVASTARLPGPLNDCARSVAAAIIHRNYLLKFSREHSRKQSNPSVQVPGHCAPPPVRYDPYKLIDEEAIDLKKTTTAHPIVFACRAIAQPFRAPTFQLALPSRSPLRPCGCENRNASARQLGHQFLHAFAQFIEATPALSAQRPSSGASSHLPS